MSNAKESLLGLLSVPTAPYRESAVKKVVGEYLNLHAIPHFSDPVGNIIVGASSKKDYLSQLKSAKDEPLRIFIAHLDHPGFHGKNWIDDSTLEVEWFGGSPVELLEGAKVRLQAGLDKKAKGTVFAYEAEGTLTNIELAPHGRAMKKATVKISKPLNSPKPNPVASTISGAFAFRSPVWTENEIIYSKCCDDLIGVSAILELARKAYGKKSKKRPPFIGLLTRAEEVGFIGAIGHFELGWLKEGKRPRFVVSLETSKELPGAIIGQGPILRLGDRMNVFDSGLTHWLVKLAEKTLPGETQKRVMDGGSCEGSAALAYGLRTIALSVPLGNYHNQSFQGGPDSRHPNGPAPEFVAEKDVERLGKMVEAIVREKVDFDRVYLPVRTAFKKAFQTAKPLLKAGQKE